MEIILRGVRGSIANPSPDTVFYGGNTSCVELRADNGALLFFDAGTGLREAGRSLPESGECHLFVSHGHTDHLLGLWFFMPLHSPEWMTHLYLPEWMGNLPAYMSQCGFFPVDFSELRGGVRIQMLKPGGVVTIPGPGSEKITVEAREMNHPGGGYGYRVRADGALFAYSGDHEIAETSEAAQEAADFLAGADVAVVDATYGWNDYREGWGHSCWQDWVTAAKKSKARHLLLSHHDPVRSDQSLDKLDQLLSLLHEEGGPNVHVAKEGMRFTPAGPIPFVRHGSDWLFRFLEDLSVYRDEGAILDRILAKAREITHADAGTIYLREGNELVFSYTHNDTLFSADSAHRHVYANIRMPISTASITGYVAETGTFLNIDNVRRLPEGAPYSFNDSFDRASGYRTVSTLVIPFFCDKGKVSGVMQIINSMDPQNVLPCPFSPQMVYNVRLLAREAGSILERSLVERRGIYGILRMATVHDPCETGPHAERVGAVSAELYHLWAERRGHDIGAIRYEKNRIRLAAMLHDIGKVGISDLVLKKNGKLSAEELKIMRAHTEKGAMILAEDPGEIAQYARGIALHHHQKWNGQGYLGASGGGKLSGKEIPLGARITAIADVFDALVSPRCYKDPWPFDQALAAMEEQSGKHFDPELIGCLLEMRQLLDGIYKKFPDAAAL